MTSEAGLAVACEPGRARPLSGGLWSLLSWLRREDHSSSSDSLSSAGSDRTAVSFSFIAPPLTQSVTSALPPPPSITDSYKKRVRDRNLRRQQDRDLTLHRKYGLYYGYDAFSLPPARKTFNEPTEERDRERRANSESLPRRPAHVPGKRRAPLPPSRPHSVISTSSLGRRQNRKRPAPQPPVSPILKIKENLQASENCNRNFFLQMNSKSDYTHFPLSNVNEDQSKKYGKKITTSKDMKPYTEKNFLKQFFENRNRSSTSDPAPERILPSISELDKQAAQIIESCKLKPIEGNNNPSTSSTSETETWFCTRCLRKYNSTIVTCQHCLPEQKRLSNCLKMSASVASSTYTQTENAAVSNVATNRISGLGDQEKQKLKEMLKEMKNSLPKRPKHDVSKPQEGNVYAFDSNRNSNASLETPTLRIGATTGKETKLEHVPQPSSSKQVIQGDIKIVPNMEKLLPKLSPTTVTEQVVITQQVVLVGPQPKEHNPKTTGSCIFNKNINSVTSKNEKLKTDRVDVNNIHTPLKISSLLNPVYIPKEKQPEKESKRSLFFSEKGFPDQKLTSTKQENLYRISNTTNATGINETLQNFKHDKKKTIASAADNTAENKPKVIQELNVPEAGPSSLPISKTASTQLTNSAISTSVTLADKTKLIDSNMVKFTTDQHARRRDLINQLEKSISSGDERAASEAAAKLAQLRLSCSVLSFTSQIMVEKMRATSNNVEHLTKEVQATTSSVKVSNATPLSTVGGAEDVPAENKIAVTAKDDYERNPMTDIDSKPKQAQIKSENNLRKIVSSQPSVSKQNANENNNVTTIQVWVEDREATRGPLRLHIPRQALMAELRQQAETTLGLAGALQRWIVGRTLCNDDRTPLVTLAGPDLAAPFYLCVVESENKTRPLKNPTVDISENKRNQGVRATSVVYSELVQLEQRALVVNTEPFECSICIEECAVGNGAVLRECVHTFCRECLSDLIRHCEEPVISCPAVGCPAVLQEREIRALVTPEEYERWLARGLAAAESGTKNAFHCRTRDCTGWAMCDPGVRKFPCPVCKHTNCIPCQAIHEGETCEHHQKKLEQGKILDSAPTDEGTQALLNNLITKGEALKCPECSAIITKKWGCDWVKCSACKTEICWVTRGRRWGPAGKGDTSGGCRCGVDGKKCHPSCCYCH